jgi:hypothetical protein
MRHISLFFRRGSLSSEIRGRQIGAALQATLNPTKGFDDDLCILVKVLPKTLTRTRALSFNPDHIYLDILDYSGGVSWLKARPSIKVIAASRSSEQYLRTHCPRNHIVFIPQHHCNLQRLRRPARPVKTVAYVGLMPTPPPWYDEVNTAVAKMGLEMRYFTKFRTKEDVVAAYLQTDIQFTWYDETMSDRWRQMKNALKVVNAASFGIPTVASFEPAYVAECKGQFVPCGTLELAFEAIRELQRPALYDVFTGTLPAFAEPYHIDNIAQLYRKLAE